MGMVMGTRLFSLCHMIGMLSALVNPVLYGYFNKVILSEDQILNAFSGVSRCICVHVLFKKVY